ncbi:alpha/beta hydrolase-fold protein [Krasilnikovia sp. M28-CT-15]|uniref:alpha/beta hydrolase-fold protein n=1 Tax=Krasilnikovia sp. M28-CT-15 TaxID=3373540 RepID=UPI003875C245
MDPNRQPQRLTRHVDRRGVLAGGLVALGLTVAATAARPLARPFAQRFGVATPVVPDAPAGDERLEQRISTARGRTVDFYTAVPAGHGAGRGLPVCLILHGGSKFPPDFSGLGLGRFVTDAVRRGAPPFVLAGASGDRLGWRPGGPDDPQRMVRAELPVWCRARGFDTSRLAAWGWSMGGAGSLLLAEAYPGLLRGVAAFSPAVVPGDDVFSGVHQLGRLPVGLWCGRDDSLYDMVRSLERALPAPPVAGGYADGRHNFAYWSTVVPAAFDFIARTLAR